MRSDDDLQEMLEALKAEYRRNLPATLERIAAAWKALVDESADAASVKSLERALHSVAGAAGTFGLPALSDAAATAEAFVEPFAARGEIPNAEERAQLGSLLDLVRKEATA